MTVRSLRQTVSLRQIVSLRQTVLHLFLLVALTGLWGCAPQTDSSETRTSESEAVRSVHFFFSSEAWGGLPFTISERQQILVRATLSRSIVRAERPVRFAADEPVRVSEAVAVYEVDKRQGLPTLVSGYRLELQVPESLLGNQITLVNRSSNVARVVTLSPNMSPGHTSP